MNRTTEQTELSRVRSLKFDEIKSVRPKSIVLEYRPNNQIFKSYSPRDFPKYLPTEEVGSESSVWIQNQGYAEYRKEVAILKAAARLEGEESFAPELIDEITGLKCFVMGKLPYSTWDTYFAVKVNGEKQKVAKEFMDTLVAFHGVMGRNFSELYHQVKRRGGYSALEPREVKNEYYRWLSYFETIIYGTSSDFAKFLQEGGKNVQLDLKEGGKAQRKRVRKLVHDFAQEVGLDLEEAIYQIVKTDRKIIYGSSEDLVDSADSLDQQLKSLGRMHNTGLVTIVHGDFKPNNVFRVPIGSQVKVCDFPEMRMDARAYDLVSAIYTNAFLAPRNPTEEVAALELVKHYVDGIRAEEGIEIDRKSFIVSTQEMRLKRLVYLFSADCIYFNKQLNSFYRNLPQFSKVESNSGFKAAFLDKMFRKVIRGLNDEILSGELGGFIHEFDNSTLLHRQVEAVEEIFVKTDVLEPSIKGRRRGDLGRIIAPPESIALNPESNSTLR